MIPAKIKQLLKEESIQDFWWVCVDGKVQEKRLGLQDILKERKKFEKHSIQIMHGNLTIEPHSEWISFQFPKKRSSRSRTPSKKKTIKDMVISMEQREVELLKAELLERKKFIEVSERKLMRKAMEMEFRQAELEQLNEEVEMKQRKVESFASIEVINGGRQSESA